MSDHEREYDQEHEQEHHHCDKVKDCCDVNIYINSKDCKPKPCPPHPHPKPCPCPQSEFAEVFSTAEQDLFASPGANLAGGVVKLENSVFSTSGIDISMAGSNGSIIINKSGWYDVYTGLCGSLNPIQSPLPVWTLSLFRNGVIVPGSTFANMTLSPEQKANEIVADVFVHLLKGDKLELANTSNANVVLTAPALGTNAQTNSAYLKLILLQEDQVVANPQVDAANASFLASFSAAQLAYLSATTVNLSQLPADALIAQTDAIASVTALNASSVALLAAQPFSTPASYAIALANLNAAMAQAALVVTQAAVVVGSLTPANTSALVAQAAIANTAAAQLLAFPLVAM